jgi:aerobic carbon-monoxide dehydrogenase large subunit
MPPSNTFNLWSGRVEDERLLRGQGRFGDDLREQNTAFAYFLRSPHAFAKILKIEVLRAKTMPGVLAIFTGADLAQSNYESVTVPYPLANCEKIVAPFRPALAVSRVMHVGEAVAVVIAESVQQAQDAAERIDIEYQILAAATTGALSTTNAQLWPEANENIVLDYYVPADPEGSKAEEIARRFARSSHVAKIELKNQRLAAVSLEPRVATGLYDPNKDQLTLRCGSQGVAGIHREVCRAMRLTAESLRVFSFDVGGGFGMKASPYPEYIVVLHAAKALQRPIHWVSTRTEAFQTDNQARDSEWKGELAIDEQGRFLALRVEVIANLGAYLTGVGHYCATRHVKECLPGMYDIPYVSLHTRCVFTNTAPVGPYRGAGRPETNYLLERLIDTAAREMGFDQAELRRINLLASDRIPFTTDLGNTYDSGDFPGLFEKALAVADYANFPTRRANSKNKGLQRGLGIGCYLENAGAFPEESARISFHDSTIFVSIGAGSSGQGHETVFRALVADRLEMPQETIKILSGDSARDVPGFGAVASRSAMMVGGAIVRACDAAIRKGTELAALLLQTTASEVRYSRGEFKFSGSDQALTLFEIAARASDLVQQSAIREDMDTTATVNAPACFPNGCHIAEVEIDPETGSVGIASYVGVDDCGNVLNPKIAEGQFHGGVVQGIGQALYEAMIYDDAGQMISGSFMDYGMPRAFEIPPLSVFYRSVAAKTNPLGVKGVGESGTTAAPCAVINAVANALTTRQVEHLDMPATAERIWRALQLSSIE